MKPPVTGGDPMFTRTDGGLYQFWFDGVVVYAALEVGFVFDRAIGCLLKHGPTAPARWLLDWYDQARTQCLSMGAPQMAEDMLLVRSSDWDLDQINAFIQTSDAIGSWWKASQLIQA